MNTEKSQIVKEIPLPCMPKNRFPFGIDRLKQIEETKRNNMAMLMYVNGQIEKTRKKLKILKLLRDNLDT